MCKGMHECTGTHAGHRMTLDVIPQVLTTLFQAFTPAWNFPQSLDQQDQLSPGSLPLSASPALGLETCAITLPFLLQEFWGLDSSPPACKGSTLAPATSPQHELL